MSANNQKDGQGVARPTAADTQSADETAGSESEPVLRRGWELTPIAPQDLLLSVIIPVYNEEDTLEAIVFRVQQEPTPKEIILINDGSSDDSLAILEKLAEQENVRVIHHEKNIGKGAALKTGFKAARGSVVMIQDADLEYDPRDYQVVLKPLIEGRADVVYGSRFLVREYARVHLYSHYLGNRVLTFLSNVFTGLNLTDMETCYKAFRLEIVKQIDLESKRFDVEPEITAKIAKLRCRIYEVPISYAGRDFSEGKKISWRDGFAAIWAIFKFNVFR